MQNMEGVFVLIWLYILLAVVLLLVLVLLLPVTAYVSFDKKFNLKIKLAGVIVFALKPKEKIKKPAAISDKKAEKETKTVFEKIKDKNGFFGAIKEIFAFLSDCIGHLQWLFKFVRFRKICFNLTVASKNAAQTALEYGALCSVVYPVLSFFDSIANVKYKQINVESDFDNNQSNFDFSLIIKLQIIFLLVAVLKIFKEYKKFSLRNDL